MVDGVLLSVRAAIRQTHPRTYLWVLPSPVIQSEMAPVKKCIRPLLAQRHTTSLEGDRPLVVPAVVPEHHGSLSIKDARGVIGIQEKTNTIIKIEALDVSVMFII